MSAGLLLPPSPFASGDDTPWERVARTHSHVITCLSSGWWIWDSVGVRIYRVLFFLYFLCFCTQCTRTFTEYHVAALYVCWTGGGKPGRNEACMDYSWVWSACFLSLYLSRLILCVPVFLQSSLFLSVSLKRLSQMCPLHPDSGVISVTNTKTSHTDLCPIQTFWCLHTSWSGLK